MTAAFSPKEDDKKNGLKHVCYEIEQLLGCLCLLNSPESLSPAIKNAILESAITHIRNLYEFFNKKRRELSNKWSDNIVSEDYGFSQNSKFSSFSNIEEIHKRLSHISYKRTPGYQWTDIKSKSIEILNESCSFVEHLLSQGNAHYDDYKENLLFLKEKIAELTSSTKNPSSTQIPVTLSSLR